jgi:hypothetical protein
VNARGNRQHGKPDQNSKKKPHGNARLVLPTCCAECRSTLGNASREEIVPPHCGDRRGDSSVDVDIAQRQIK